jgi:hypothetical protein
MQLAQRASGNSEEFQSEQATQRGRRTKMTTQATTLRMTGCRVDTQSITISFSEAVDVNTTPSTDFATALNPSNYIIFAPSSGFNQTPLPEGWNGSALPDGRTVVLTAPAGATNAPSAFAAGEWVQISIAQGPNAGIGLYNTQKSPVPISGSISGRVPSLPARQVRDVEDAISYPVLTEDVTYRPSSPVGIPKTGAGGIAGPGASNIGQIAMQAVTDVLGWKVNTADPKGFLGALTQSFSLKDVEGHVESTWMPRSYAVQTDLGGGITGAQASLYMRAKDALDQSLSLLDGLYPLDPDADPEYVRALREMARSQMNEIVKELGVVGLPSILRINTYFKILLGQDITKLPPAGVQLDPDQIRGTLGDIRKEYGIYFEGNPFNNSVEDEQDITNFRVISDYMTSLCQSWIVNRKFFEIESKQPAFFGTQLVLISRQFNVIAETVNEVRFALDSVFIGPNERQTLLLKFPDGSKFPSMYLEDVLDEVDSFVTNEGPRLLRDGGKISVTNNILPVVRDLKDMIELTRDQKDYDVPKGFRTARVRRAIDDLTGQLDQLRKLTEQVEQKLPTPLTDLVISSISVTAPPSAAAGGFTVEAAGSSKNWRISIFGNAFDPAAEVAIYSAAPLIETLKVEYFSAQRIDVIFDPIADNLPSTDHDIEVTNPNGQFALLSPAFNWNSEANNNAGAMTPIAKGSGKAKSRPRFATVVNVEGVEAWGEGNAFSASPTSSNATQDAANAAPANSTATPAANAGSPNVNDTIKKSHDSLRQEFMDELKAVEQRLASLFKGHSGQEKTETTAEAAGLQDSLQPDPSQSQKA